MRQPHLLSSVLLLLSACSSVKFGEPLGEADAGAAADAGPAAVDAAAPDPECEADTSICTDNVTVHCDSNGRPAEVEPCALGCYQDGTRCVDVDPSNDLAAYLDMADGAPIVVLSSGALIDTDAGTVEDGDGTVVAVPDFQVPAPAGGVPVRVFVVKSLSLADTTVVGRRALAILSDGDVVIRGHVRVLAGAMTEDICGGGDATCEGNFLGSCGGGGGGGFGGAGGRGGTASAEGTTGTGGSPGATSGNPSLVPLRGGCPGGSPQGVGSRAAGGGAIQLVSRTAVLLDQQGAVPFMNVGGEGGSAYAGGGSGGGILIEAPRVTVPSGTGLAANGGSGGCAGTPGSDGRPSVLPAAGATCPAAREADGGDGSRASNANGQPGDNVSSAELDGVYIAGGAGGGGGRIRVNVPTEEELDRAGSMSGSSSVGTLQTR